MDILFDLYGTLIDINTDEFSDDFWIEFAKNMNVSDYKKLKNDYYNTCAKYQKLKEELEIKDVFKDIVDFDVLEACLIFRKLSTKYICLYDGVVELLDELSKEHNLYVLSNAQASFTIPELKELGIYDYFKDIAISSDYGIKKPNIMFFKEAINNFNLKDDIVMIGNDYECDIKPAKKLGLKTVFIESNLTPLNKCEDKIMGFNRLEILEKIKELENK